MPEFLTPGIYDGDGHKCGTTSTSLNPSVPDAYTLTLVICFDPEGVRDGRGYELITLVIYPWVSTLPAFTRRLQMWQN